MLPEKQGLIQPQEHQPESQASLRSSVGWVVPRLPYLKTVAWPWHAKLSSQAIHP